MLKSSTLKLLLVASLTSGSLSGCSLLLKNVFVREVDEGPIAAPPALVEDIRKEERNGYVPFLDKRNYKYTAVIKSAFNFEGKDYAVAMTGEGHNSKQVLILQVMRPYVGALRFSVINDTAEFEKVTKFLAKHKNLVRGNMPQVIVKENTKPPALSGDVTFDVDSYKLVDGWYQILASSSFNDIKYQLEFKIQDGLEPALLPNGTQNKLCHVALQSVRMMPVNPKSNLYLKQMSQKFKIIEGGDVLRAQSIFSCLPQMNHPFKLAKEKVVLRLYQLEKGESGNYCDAKLTSDLPNKKITVDVDSKMFYTPFLRYISEQ